MAIDVTKRNESVRCKHHTQSEMEGSGTENSVDRILTTMVKLTDANKEALNLYGNLDEFSLPDALYEASTRVGEFSETCSFQLLQRSAELLHPRANRVLGGAYKYGLVLEKDRDLALFHFRIASSREDTRSTMELIAHYYQENDTKNVENT